ncbi:MAG: HEAT repeat domain-containing protein [Eubacteriales bacterium]|nr:HEAT repeat domain-containing protein [Eubacteriales bacterium]
MMFGSKEDKINKAIEKKQPANLIKFSQDKDKSIVLAAIKGLGQVKDDDCFNALVPFLSNPDSELRGAAAAALGEQGNAHGKAFLLHAFTAEKDEKVKKLMEQASGKLGDY